MNFISSCLVWEKTYYVFDEKEQLSCKKLNIFKRFFRVLGFYADTRLKTVGNIAYRACFNPNPTWSSEEKTTIIKLVKKLTMPTHSFWLLPSPPYYCQLGEKTLSTGETIRYKGYILDKEDFKNSTYKFTIDMIKNNTIIRKSRIALAENQNNRLKVQSIEEDPAKPNWDFISFLTDPNDALARITYLFLSKIVNDSQYLNGLDMSDKGYPIGGAGVAQSYGFTGEVNEYFIYNDTHTIEKANHLKLEKSDAQKIAHDCLLEAPVSVDFLLKD